MNDLFVRLDAWLVALILALAMIAAWRIGLWIGGRGTGDAAPSVSKFDDAGLALLGLLLAFTFSMAIGKHDQRRAMVVTDANSIGDFYTCASLLKEPMRTQLQTVIRDYTSMRLDLARQVSANSMLKVQSGRFNRCKAR